MAFAERYIDTPEGRTGGPGTSHDNYHPWFSRLAEEHAVVYLDHTGCGRSDRVADGMYSVELFARNIEHVRSELGVESLAIVGLSFGAYPALDHALRHPDRLRALVLSNGHASAETWQATSVVGADPEWTVEGTLAGFDVRPRLGAIEAPTLVVSGRYDRLTPPSVALEIYEALPPDHRRLHVFERSAHRPWAEEPDAYFDVVGAFLRR